MISPGGGVGGDDETHTYPWAFPWSQCLERLRAAGTSRSGFRNERIPSALRLNNEEDDSYSIRHRNSTASTCMYTYIHTVSVRLPAIQTPPAARTAS